jgi:hypothetical protein
MAGMGRSGPRLLGEGVLDHRQSGRLARRSVPIMPRSVGEGHALLRGEEAGMDGGAGGVHHLDRALAHGAGEAGRAARLAEGHGAGLDGGDAARADQHVGLHAAGRQADDVQARRPRAISGPRHGHGDAGIVDGQRELGAVRHHPGEVFERVGLHDGSSEARRAVAALGGEYRGAGEALAIRLTAGLPAGRAWEKPAAGTRTAPEMSPAPSLGRNPGPTCCRR